MLLVVLFIPTVADARFTRAVCFHNDCLQRNRYNTLCYHPDPDTPIDEVPKRTCADPTLASALGSHLYDHARRPTLLGTWNPSSAYYMRVNDTWMLVGNADYIVASTVPRADTLVVCHTGLVKGEARDVRDDLPVRHSG